MQAFDNTRFSNSFFSLPLSFIDYTRYSPSSPQQQSPVNVMGLAGLQVECSSNRQVSKKKTNEREIALLNEVGPPPMA